jgi:Tannase and feruloyl esterase
MQRLIKITLFGLALSLPLFGAEFHTSDDCTSILSLVIPDTEIHSAAVVPASGTFPQHCRVTAVTHGEPGSNVGVEVRMPDGWNEKILATTRQGYMGSFPPLTNPAEAPAIARRYAIITTDGGHVGPSILDATFAYNNRPAEIDYGYRGLHLAKVVGTAIITAYYGRGPIHSYYQGCSSSGRYGLQSAQRYPTDFDGIIAGAPDPDLTGLCMSLTWDMQATLAAPIPASKLSVLGAAVHAACDAIDGLVDGLIDDPRSCNFDLNTLLCPGDDAPGCFTDDQVATLRKLYGGPEDSSGHQIYPGLAFGGETPDPVGKNGWDQYITGVGSTPPIDLALQDQFLKYLAFDVDDPNFDWRTFNFFTDPQRMETMHEILDPSFGEDLSTFQASGGKMIIYQGWSDIGNTPFRTIQYYERLRAGQGRRRLEDSVRLFMVPGMHHCIGGEGPNTFDALRALERWVEQGEAPSSIIAAHTSGSPGTDRTRPLCPFPQHAVYTGSGSIDDAANFKCEGPPIGTDH